MQGVRTGSLLHRAVDQGNLEEAQQQLNLLEPKNWEVLYSFKHAIKKDNTSLVELFLTEKFGRNMLINSWGMLNEREAGTCLGLAKGDVLTRLQQEEYFQGITPVTLRPRPTRPGK